MKYLGTILVAYIVLFILDIMLLESDRNSHPKTSRINQSESDRNSQS